MRVPSLVLGIGIATALSACAAGPEATKVGAAPATAACVDRDAPVGTNITRRDKSCIALTDAERTAAQAQLERAADRQSTTSAGAEAGRMGR